MNVVVMSPKVGRCLERHVALIAWEASVLGMRFLVKCKRFLVFERQTTLVTPEIRYIQVHHRHVKL